MRIKENCKLPWEVICILLGIVGLFVTGITNNYAVAAYAVSFVVIAAVAFYMEREPTKKGEKDDYGFRALRFIFVLLMAGLSMALVAIVVQSSSPVAVGSVYVGGSKADLNILLTAFGVNIAGAFIGWIGSWCERCIEWK